MPQQVIDPLSSTVLKCLSVGINEKEVLTLRNEIYESTENYTEIVHRYKSTVYGIALSRVHCRSDADDIFQEVFLRYCQKNRTFFDEEHRKSWIINVTLKCCRKYSADPYRRRTIPIEDSEDTPVFDSHELNELHSVMLKIPEKYSTVLYLYYIEDLPVRKIASMLGRRESAVRMQLSRGREMLRQKMKGEYPNE